MSLRIRFALTFILLLLVVFCAIFAARSTVETWQQLREQNTLTQSGDVSTISSWMTIPYIAHTYHVPEPYLYSQLKIPASPLLHHTTLHSLATRYNRPLDHLVKQIQGVIISYRKQHKQNTIKTAATPPGFKKSSGKGAKQ